MIQKLSGGKSELTLNKRGQEVKRTREPGFDKNNHAAYLEVNKATRHTALHMVQTHEPVEPGNHTHSREKARRLRQMERAAKKKANG